MPVNCIPRFKFSNFAHKNPQGFKKILDQKNEQKPKIKTLKDLKKEKGTGIKLEIEIKKIKTSPLSKIQKGMEMANKAGKLFTYLQKLKSFFFPKPL